MDTQGGGTEPELGVQRPGEAAWPGAGERDWGTGEGAGWVNRDSVQESKCSSVI